MDKEGLVDLIISIEGWQDYLSIKRNYCKENKEISSQFEQLKLNYSKLLYLLKQEYENTR